jgi:hypothetical protein
VTPDEFRLRLRQELDDEVGNPRKAGVFWSDPMLTRQLDQSQFEILRMLFEKGAELQYQNLYAGIAVPLTANPTRAQLPADYLFAVTCNVDGRTARVHMMREAVVFENLDDYAACIEGEADGSGNLWVEFTGSAGKTAELWYIRKPLSFSVLPNVSRTEFSSLAYRAIYYHAAATLAIKDESNKRFEAKLESTLRRLFTAPPSMLVPYQEEIR